MLDELKRGGTGQNPRRRLQRKKSLSIVKLNGMIKIAKSTNPSGKENDLTLSDLVLPLRALPNSILILEKA